MTPYYSDSQVTLYHGDCREVLRGLADESVDLVLTDPPYGHRQNDYDLASRWEVAIGRGPAMPCRPILNDGPEANDLARFLFSESQRLLVPGGCCCCCGGGGGPDPQFARWSIWLDEAIGFKHAVVWDKGGLGMGWHYRRNYEMILIGEKPGAACKWYGGNTQANVVRIPGIKPQAGDHPTPKPEALMALFVRLHSQPGEVVLDPFAGHGTTLRAAKDLGRKAIGIELDEKHCEAAAKRMRQETLPLWGARR